MKISNLRELQILELEISKEIKRICDKNSIEYFIIGGTLLGAVRHKGFIPWDDDMDIGMTTENYQKFLKVAPIELNEKFFLQTVDSDKNYYNTFSKVRLNGTHMYEKVTEHLNINNGVFVDIFPYDLASKDVVTSKLYMRKLQVLGKASLLKHGYNLNCITENFGSRCVNICLKHFPLSVKTIDKVLCTCFMCHGDKDNQNYYIERDGMFKGDFVFPTIYFEPLIELPFEDTKFKAPGDYDAYLKKAYGNYMEFPPEKEREKGHSVRNIELEYDFESYFESRERRTSYETASINR